MLDILLLAFWTDTTRIGTFMFGDAQTQQDYSFLPGVKGGFHSISHHRNEEEKRAAVREDRHLARRADRVVPEQAEESR